MSAPATATKAASASPRPSNFGCHSFSPVAVPPNLPAGAVGIPRINEGGPCLPLRKDGREGFAFSGNQPGSGEDLLSAEGFFLNGVGCGGMGGESGWEVLTTPLPVSQRRNAATSFRFVSTIVTDPELSDSNWLYMNAREKSDGGKGVVWCGAGRGIRRWILLRPVGEPLPFADSPLRPGGRYAIIDGVDAKGAGWTCAFGNGPPRKKKRGGDSGSTGDKGEGGNATETGSDDAPKGGGSKGEGGTAAKTESNDALEDSSGGGGSSLGVGSNSRDFSGLRRLRRFARNFSDKVLPVAETESS